MLISDAYRIYHLLQHTRQSKNLIGREFNRNLDILPTSYRHLTDTSPTVGRLSVICRPTVGRLIVYVLGKTCWPSVGRQTADSRPTVGRQSADRRPTVGQQTADSRPTGFLGSSSSQLPILQQHHC